MERVSITVTEETLLLWSGLLRRGVGVFLDAAMTVRELMTDVLGMDLEYATHKVPGLFLNNAPVDDWSSELVGGGDEMGLSGTMPGMAGIALRRSSPIRSFRADLNSRHDACGPAGGLVTIKMFNFVANDCCRNVLERGVVLSPMKVSGYLEEKDITLEGCSCSWNGAAIDGHRIREALAGISEDIVLTVTTE